METFSAILQDLLIFVGAMTIILMALLAAIFVMHRNNRLRPILAALSYRVGATLGAGLVAIPIEPIPLIDMLYDVGVPILLLYYWYTFFRNIASTHATTHNRGN